jgi:hypothetical protein
MAIFATTSLWISVYNGGGGGGIQLGGGVVQQASEAITDAYFQGGELGSTPLSFYYGGNGYYHVTISQFDQNFQVSASGYNTLSTNASGYSSMSIGLTPTGGK